VSVDLETIWVIFINFLSNLLWFLAGFISHSAISRFREWKKPRYWREIMNRRIVLVVGSHGYFDPYESSGMIGTGDALALAELVTYFRQNRFEEYDIVSASSISPNLLQRNLILIGGPDANTVSQDFTDRVSKDIRTNFGDPQKSEIFFQLEEDYYMPRKYGASKDAAAIIFHKSPYSSDGCVLLLSGCFGHGTLAAAQTVCRSKMFSRKTRKLRYFEAALTCDVVGQAPTAIQLQRLV